MVNPPSPGSLGCVSETEQVSDGPTGPTAAPRHHSALAWLWGPAFVASVAYVDPGNVAANLTSGARFGYKLVWVLVLANLIAMLVQYLSAKLGLVTGRSLPELLGERMHHGPRLAFLAQAEIVAIATDLAEVVGGAIALQILFGLPLIVGGVIISVVSMLLLGLQSCRGQRTFEQVIIGLLIVITVGFVAGLFVGDVHWGDAARGLLPGFAGRDSVLLASSMLGATVMPHAIYVHSALVRDRHGQASGSLLERLLRATRWEVLTSLAVAGAVNLAMLILAAANLGGVTDTDSIQGAHAAIDARLGPVIGVLFGIGLLASSLASTSVGTYAGATIMQGLLKVRRPSLPVLRIITLAPALGLLATGIDPTWALVLSQVLLSLGIPFALIPLAVLTGQHRTLGSHANGRALAAVTWLAVALIVALNVALVILTLTG